MPQMGEWPSVLSHYCRIGRFPFHSALGAQPGLETQPRYEIHGDSWVEISLNAR